MKDASGILYGIYRGTQAHEPWVVACLQGAWSRLIGARLAEACRPSALRGHRLEVEVLDPTWLTALEGMRTELVERVRAATGGEVRSVELRAARRSSPSA
jgi:hypothetical protein